MAPDQPAEDDQRDKHLALDDPDKRLALDDAPSLAFGARLLQVALERRRQRLAAEGEPR